MNLEKVIGDVKLQLENGEIIPFTSDQIFGLMEENKQLRKTNKLLTEELDNISNSLNENEIKMSEVKLQHLLETLGVC